MIYMVVDGYHDHDEIGATADRAEAERWVKVWNDLVNEERARLPDALPYWCKPEEISFYELSPLPADPATWLALSANPSAPESE